MNDLLSDNGTQTDRKRIYASLFPVNRQVENKDRRNG